MVDARQKWKCKWLRVSWHQHYHAAHDTIHEAPNQGKRQPSTLCLVHADDKCPASFRAEKCFLGTKVLATTSRSRLGRQQLDPPLLSDVVVRTQIDTIDWDRASARTAAVFFRLKGNTHRVM